MEKLEKKVKGIFWFSLILSILAVISIPAVVFSAIYQLWILLALSCVIISFAFYGLPFFWISYADKKRMNAIVDAIELDGIQDVKNLSVNFNRKEKIMIFELKRILQKRYLTGYIIENNERLVKVSELNEGKSNGVSNKCPNCGSITSTVINGNYRCDYCGTIFKK